MQSLAASQDQNREQLLCVLPASWQALDANHQPLTGRGGIWQRKGCTLHPVEQLATS